MTKLAIAKVAAKTIVGISASYVIHSIVKNNTNPDTPIDQMKVFVGAFVIGTMVADVAARYTDVKIEEAADQFNAARQK
jgi:hypothetical protein